MITIQNAEFESKGELKRWVASKQLSREDLQRIYERIPGAKKVKRIRNRPTAIDMIWRAASAGTKPVKTAKREGNTKRATLVAMLSKGTTVADVMSVTGWQAHTVRGLISTLNSKGVIKVSTERKDGVTHYKAEVVAA